MMSISRALFFAFFSFIALNLPAQTTISLEEVLRYSEEQADQIQSIHKALESLRPEFNTRDLELSPTLSVEYAEIRDARETLQSSKTDAATNTLLTINKLFSTGTRFEAEIENINADLSTTTTDNYTTDWQVELSQALWRNSFGRATRMRQNADRMEMKSQYYTLLFEKNQYLILIERTYWELALAIKEMQITENNLQRSREIEKWVRTRLNHAAAERVDLLQAQALVKTREQQQLFVQRQIESTMDRVHQILPQLKNRKWTPDLAALDKNRSLNKIIAVTTTEQREANAIRLDALAAQFRAQQAQYQHAQKRSETLPQLDIYYRYGKNAIDTHPSVSWKDAFAEDDDYHEAGVMFSTPIDFSILQDQKKVTRLKSDSESFAASRLKKESDMLWAEWHRQYQFLSESVEISKALADIQDKKSKEERRRYERGRSTAFQALTFEVEAAESQLQVYRNLTELRKHESQMRLFSFEDLP